MGCNLFLGGGSTPSDMVAHHENEHCCRTKTLDSGP